MFWITFSYTQDETPTGSVLALVQNTQTTLYICFEYKQQQQQTHPIYDPETDKKAIINSFT